MDHQDWKPVVLVKPKTKETELKKGNFVTEKKFSAGTNKNNKSDILARKLEDEEIPVIAKVSKKLADAISDGRRNKNLTRKELANLCNMKESDITLYETCKAIPRNDQLQLMSKHLGIVLRKNM
jgi:ribosome-binding protein aMBF1 (putative translation factor)